MAGLYIEPPPLLVTLDIDDRLELELQVSKLLLDVSLPFMRELLLSSPISCIGIDQVVQGIEFV